MEKNPKESTREWPYNNTECPPEARIALEGLVDSLIKEADKRAFKIMHEIARKATESIVKVAQ